MWPQTPSALMEAQEELASARPAPWRPAEARPLVAACFVCFGRRAPRRLQQGEPAWVGAVSMEAGRRVVDTVVVRGETRAPYEPALLALREDGAAAAVG